MWSVILTSGHVLSVDEFWLSKRSSVHSSRLQNSLKPEDERSEERKFIEAARTGGRGRQARNLTIDFRVQDQEAEDSRKPIQVPLKAALRHATRT
jgi:hypothetical protein